MIAVSFQLQRLLAVAILTLGAGCVSLPQSLDVRVEVGPNAAVRPVNVRMAREGQAAVVRGAVYAGPGYRRWQHYHLVIEVRTPDQRTVLSQSVAFRPEPIPRRVRGRAYSHFSVELPLIPPPGSLLRVMPAIGPVPTSTSSH